MATRRSPLATAAIALVCCGRLGAQTGTQPPPTPAPVPVPVQDPPPTQEPAPAPSPPPADPTDAAAELLRRRLGLQPGPAGAPPPGPPAAPAAQDPPATPPTTPATAQDPPPDRPLDPTEAARRAVQRLLPNATPPPSAPMPNASGTPEPAPPGDALAATRREPPAPRGLVWSGTLATRYRARRGGSDDDQDLTARLGLDVGDRERDRYTFHVAARGFGDLDGGGDDTFTGLDHSFGDDVNLRLYTAHVDAHRLGAVELVRVGRQYLDEAPTPLSFDGARLDSAPAGSARAFVSAYGGVPVHQFENSARGDLVYGLGGGFVPWSQARVRLDWMALRDEFLAQDRRDELYGLRWWQQLGALQLHGLHTWRDSRPRDLHLGARGELPAALTVRADWRELLTTQRAQVTELDPFFAVAFAQTPYRQLDLAVERDFGVHMAIGLGADLRRLRDGGDESAFNREFDRLHADLWLRDLGLRGLGASFAASSWQTTGEDFRAATGELEYRPGRHLRAALGSGYDLYRYDAFANRERLHVRSYYLRGDWRVATATRLDLGYEYERNDDTEFHLFRLGVTWTL
jgi:hypothetical protein